MRQDPPADPSARPRAFAVMRDGDPLPERLRRAVVAIGNFDGVHRGHRALVDTALRLAGETRGPAAVLTFEPHPRTFFAPGKPLFRLAPEAEKLFLLERAGLDGAFVLRFDADLAALSAAAFVNDLLRGRLDVAGVVVGHDFAFGQGREGTPDRLQGLARESGLACAVVPAVTDGADPVSSSAIRRALEAGEVSRANALLGHRWFVEGEVRHGAKRGRTLGYPTANMRLPDACGLRHGIYAVRMALGDGRAMPGVASFGRRPTFDNGAPLLETFLFGFAGDLYGQVVRVELVAWIRGEERFDSARALVARMDRDAEEARAALEIDRVASAIAP